MTHPIYRVTSVELAGPYALVVGFNDGLVRSIDFKDVLHGELFGPLQDPSEFSKVYIDSEVHTLVWPCGADFDPSTLHDWPEYEAFFFWNVLHSRVLRPSKRISLVIVSGGFFARAAVGTFQFRDIRCP